MWITNRRALRTIELALTASGFEVLSHHTVERRFSVTVYTNGCELRIITESEHGAIELHTSSGTLNDEAVLTDAVSRIRSAGRREQDIKRNPELYTVGVTQHVKTALLESPGTLNTEHYKLVLAELEARRVDNDRTLDDRLSPQEELELQEESQS